MGRTRVVVGMSGGVDSSVAAALLAEAGYEVFGVTLRLWAPGDPYQVCCTEEDVWFAEETARKIGFSHRVVDVSGAFKRFVLRHSWREYERARTPNPCVRCNRLVKFAALLEEADRIGARWVATGHHARVVHSEPEHPKLHRGRDPGKDQSYFLYQLLGPPLRRILFPIGGFTKEEVRQMARRYGLASAERRDSQDACFAVMGRRHGFPEELRRQMGGRAAPGPIVDLEGRELGRHDGIHNFTIGQRRGIGIASQDGRLYVVRLDPARNAVVVGPQEALMARGLLASDMVWADGPVDGPVMVQVRSRHKAAEGTAEPIGNKLAKVWFSTPQKAVTPGQAAVLYRGTEVIGGGWIESSMGPKGSEVP